MTRSAAVAATSEGGEPGPAGEGTRGAVILGFRHGNSFDRSFLPRIAEHQTPEAAFDFVSAAFAAFH